MDYVMFKDGQIQRFHFLFKFLFIVYDYYTNSSVPDTLNGTDPVLDWDMIMTLTGIFTGTGHGTGRFYLKIHWYRSKYRVLVLVPVPVKDLVKVRSRYRSLVFKKY